MPLATVLQSNCNFAMSQSSPGVFLTGVNSRLEGIDPYIVVGEDVQYFWSTTEECVAEVRKSGFRVVARRHLPTRNGKR